MPLLYPGGAGLRRARCTGWQKCFDTIRQIVFLMRGRKMNTAFTNLQKPMRVNGHTPLWQHCGLVIGIAGSDS